MNRSILLFILFWIGLPAFSQQYHATGLYDTHGDVKQIKTSSENRFFKEKTKFDKEGRVSNMPMIFYNDAGYPIGFELSLFGKRSVEKYYWDSENRLDSIYKQVPAIGKPYEMTIKNSYVDGRVQNQLMRTSQGDDWTIYDRRFSEYEYDDRGNWIRRQVEECITNSYDDSCVKKYSETREIKYY